MSDRLIIALLLSFSTLGAIISSSPLKDNWGDGDTSISVSINDDEIKFTASYPKDLSKKVHAYLQQALHLTDLPDLRALEIKHYKTPDGLYKMHIKSRNGYIRVIMQRRSNPPETFEEIKLICEGVKKILADN